MRAYLALTRIDLRLALRNRSVIFFNYLFPLIFFFVFAGLMGSGRGGGIGNVVTMVLAIGILGNGLWGAGMRAVQEREQGILRRFKVTPISPAPILAASMVTGWMLYLPVVVLICGLAHFLYGMPMPERWLSLLAMITLGVFAFRSIGLILASVVNSTQESTVAIQLFYMPMLFLSGATIPTTILPAWAQTLGQFLPASYLVTGLQSVFLRKETLAQNGPAVGALLITMALAMFISVQIFRWEKEEKMRPGAKLWVLAVLSPFVLMGCYQAYTHEHTKKAATLWRELMRADTFLIRGARIFTGPGNVIESGSVLVRNGKIEQVYTGAGPDVEKLKVDIVEAAGDTLLPGLIDMRVRLTPADAPRALASYLYCGVTGVVNVDGALPGLSGDKLGAEVFFLKDAGSVYDPALSRIYAQSRTPAEKLQLLDRSLVQQVGPKDRIQAARQTLQHTDPSSTTRADYDRAVQSLLRAHRDGATLVIGSGAGEAPLIHGPTVQQEMELWVAAGIPPSTALTAATYNAARALHADDRIGSIEAGREADLLLVEGNPLSDIFATERISLVVYKGERIRRTALFDQK